MGSPASPVSGIPRALTIAGSDSGGGAGIQADLKVFLALGCHGMSAVTALTAQNTVGVTGIQEVSPAFVRAQIDAVVSDIGVDAAKTGMLASEALVIAVATAVADNAISPLVVDPVFISKHRNSLLAPDAVGAMRSRLFPLAAVVTPNLYEAGALVGREISSLSEMKEAAKALHELGPGAVLVKGGHLSGDRAVDVLYDGAQMTELDGARYDTEDTHGTGCALSAAIAAYLAQGSELMHAVGAAKEFVGEAIRHGLRLGAGYGPVNPGWQIQSGLSRPGNGRGSG